MAAKAQRKSVFAFGLFVFCLVFGGPLLPCRAAAPRYRVTDLGTFPGCDESEAFAINSQGQIIGVAEGGAWGRVFLRAVRWQNGKILGLGTLGGTNCFPNAINDHGQIVGVSTVIVYDKLKHAAGESHHAFLWQNGKMTDLGTFGGGMSEAEGINNAGQIVGRAETKTGVVHAALWQLNRIVDLGAPPGADSSLAFHINNHGQIVGSAALGRNANRALLWTQGRMQDLGTVPGCARHYARSINDAGQVIGEAVTADFSQEHLLLWQNGAFQPSGLSPESLISNANSINQSGQVVGKALTTEGHRRAFIWFQGKQEDLNTLIPAASGWVLEEAHSINDRGQIVGRGIHNGKKRAFLLTLPVHAPGQAAAGGQRGRAWLSRRNWKAIRSTNRALSSDDSVSIQASTRCPTVARCSDASAGDSLTHCRTTI